nr:transposase (putative), gypsy type [Tanacetum cinerariifolium]
MCSDIRNCFAHEGSKMTPYHCSLIMSLVGPAGDPIIVQPVLFLINWLTQAEETATMDPPAALESRKRGHDGTYGKSLAAIQIGLASTVVPEDAPVGVSDPDPLSFADAPSRHPTDVAQSSLGIAAAGDPESENAFSPAEVWSPRSVYQPEWGVTNGSLLDTPEACQDLVDHAAPLGYFSELRHMRNEDFLRQYNVNLARQVEIGSQMCLRFEQEAKLLRKSVAQVAHRDKRIQARELEIKNLEVQLETEAEMKKAAEDKSDKLIKELEDLRAREEKLKAAFEEFKRYEDERVEQRWVIGHGLRLAMMKCVESLEMRQTFADVVFARVAKGMSEGLKHGVEHGQAQLKVESIEAYDPEAEAKFLAALQSLKDLKYPLLDQLESLKDAPMDVIIAALYLESDIGRMPHNIYATSALAPLSSPSPCIRSNMFYAPWESLLFLDVLGIALRTRSLRPLGLQPAYAADHVQRYMAPGYSGIITEYI